MRSYLEIRIVSYKTSKNHVAKFRQAVHDWTKVYFQQISTRIFVIVAKGNFELDSRYRRTMSIGKRWLPKTLVKDKSINPGVLVCENDGVARKTF